MFREIILGIDLGTSNSCMAIVEDGKAKVIPNIEGELTTPSVVAFSGEEQWIVGQRAKRQAAMNPRGTVFSVKRLMGRKHDELDRDAPPLTCHVVKARNDDVCVTIRNRIFAPSELVALILRKLRVDAELYLGTEVKRAVITVPAYFDENQRRATKDAAAIAGITVERIINEPTAACIACVPNAKSYATVAVLHFGGGTFDISILSIDDDVYEVLATNGDTKLGGDDFDQRIINWLCDCFRMEHGIDLLRDAMAMSRIREAAEKAKCELSSAHNVDIDLPIICADKGGQKHLRMKLDRSAFESLSADLVERIVDPCKKCMRDAGLAPEDVDKLILVGGMTRMPAVQMKARELFKQEPKCSAHGDVIVALGAAIQAGVLSGDIHRTLLLDVIPLSLGVETLGGVMAKLITRNTTIPTRKSEVFSTSVDNQTSVEINVLQGEHEMARDNKSIGRFRFFDIPKAPRGIPQIEVTFDVDGNSIMWVSARDKATNHEQRIFVNASGGLTEKEIRSAVKESDSFAIEYRRSIQ
jgi:molecular chaperone DnaK